MLKKSVISVSKLAIIAVLALTSACGTSPKKETALLNQKAEDKVVHSFASIPLNEGVTPLEVGKIFPFALRETDSVVEVNPDTHARSAFRVFSFKSPGKKIKLKFASQDHAAGSGFDRAAVVPRVQIMNENHEFLKVDSKKVNVRKKGEEFEYLKEFEAKALTKDTTYFVVISADDVQIDQKLHSYKLRYYGKTSHTSEVILKGSAFGNIELTIY